MITRLLLALPLFFHALALQTEAQENRIPFYEDYLQKSDLVGFIRDAKKFLAEKPDAKEAPRMAMDYLMAAKAARNSSIPLSEQSAYAPPAELFRKRLGKTQGNHQ